MSEQSIKIHAYLAHCGIASRRASEKLIQEEKVWVNGQFATIGQRVDPQQDVIEVEVKPGKRTIINQVASPKYFLLNKPRGYVSTASDELGRKTVLKLLPQTEDRLYPVGRLDIDSEGLLLLTNDGDLAYTLTHPKFEVPKTYHVLLKGIPSTPALNHLKRGIKLAEEFVKPVSVSILRREEQKNTWIAITIKEGKYQQVRRMMKRTGYEVLRLIRVQMGTLELGDLPLGEVRELTEQEISNLHTLIQNRS